MDIKNINGRNLVTQHTSEIEVGSIWAPADGSNYTVEVLSVDNVGWVSYRLGENSPRKKLWLAFQSRYCLVKGD